MKMPNMGNSILYFRHSSVPGVNSFKMVGVNCGLIPDRPSEPARNSLNYLANAVASVVDARAIPPSIRMLY